MKKSYIEANYVECGPRIEFKTVKTKKLKKQVKPKNKKPS